MASPPSRSRPPVRWNRDEPTPAGAPSTGVHCLLSSDLAFEAASSRGGRGSTGESRERWIEEALRFADSGSERFLPDRSAVLWDAPKRRLVAVADSIGCFPLYVQESGRTLVFACSVEGLPAIDVDHVEVDAIAAHVCGRPPSGEATFFRGLGRLVPGSVIVADAASVRRRTPTRPTSARLPAREAHAAASQLRTTLEEVVADHAGSGEPVGLTLSSGLDSSAIAAALVASRPAASVVAFVWTAASEPSADEGAPARRIASALGLEVVEVAADRSRPLANGERIVPGLASPICNVYQETWRETCRQARRRGLRTLLTGHGGDLAFGGVFPFADLLLSGRWLRLAREIAAYRRGVAVDLPWLVRYRVLGEAARWFVPRRSVQAPPWLGSALRGRVPALPRARRWSLPGDRARERFLDGAGRAWTTSAMTGDAAGQGIALRHPWLDPRIADLARRVPATATFEGGLAKAPIRRAFRGLLPDEVLDRADKIYPTALFRGALAGPGRKAVDELLDDMMAAELGFVDPARLRRAIDDYAMGKSASSLFWRSLTLEAWLRSLPR